MSKNKTKAELLAELDSYRSFVESIDASLCRWLPDTTLVFANEKYKRIFGVQGDAVGQKWIDFLPEEMRAATAAFYSEVTKAPRPVHYEHPATAEDGSVREFHWTDTPILDENGRVVEFHSVGIDITERKRAEQILTENSARTKELLEATPDAMVIVDADGKILMVNARTEAMFGYAQHELLGAAVEILMPKELRERHLDNRAEFMARLNSVIAGGEQNIVAERKDGEIFPAEISISKHKLAGNEIVTLCAIRDVTERQRARELIIAQRDLAKMLSSDVSDVQLWETALQCAIRAAHLDSGGIYLFDEESHAFTLVY
jgi:PAS domain S-box-containing protein